MESEERIMSKAHGQSWDAIREKVLNVNRYLQDVDASVTAVCLPKTIYIKYTVDDGSTSPVFAVMWFLTSKRCFVGLATPEKIQADNVFDAPKGMIYKGLTSYVQMTDNFVLSSDFSNWVKLAFDNVKKNC